MTGTNVFADRVLNKIIELYDDYHSHLNGISYMDCINFAENVLREIGGRTGEFYFGLDNDSKAKTAIRQYIADSFLLCREYDSDEFIARKKDEQDLVALTMLGYEKEEIEDMLETISTISYEAASHETVEFTELMLFLCSDLTDEELLDFLYRFVYPPYRRQSGNFEDYSFDLVEYLLFSCGTKKSLLVFSNDDYAKDDIFILSEEKDITLLCDIWENELGTSANKKVLSRVCSHIDRIYPCCSQAGKDRICHFMRNNLQDYVMLMKDKTAMSKIELLNLETIGKVMIIIGQEIINDIQSNLLPEEYFEACRALLDFENTISVCGYYFIEDAEENFPSERKLYDRLVECAEYLRTDRFMAKLKNMLYTVAKEWAQLPQLFEDEINTRFMQNYIRTIIWLVEHDTTENQTAHFQARLINYLLEIIEKASLEKRLPFIILILGCGDGAYEADINYFPAVYAFSSLPSVGSTAEKSRVIDTLRKRISNMKNATLSELKGVMQIIKEYVYKYNHGSDESLIGTESSMLRLIYLFIGAADCTKSIYLDIESLIENIIPMFGSIITRCIRENIKDYDFFFSIDNIIYLTKYTDDTFKEYAFGFVDLIRKYYNRNEASYNKEILSDLKFRKYISGGYPLLHFYNHMPEYRCEDIEYEDEGITDTKLIFVEKEDLNMCEYSIVNGFKLLKTETADNTVAEDSFDWLYDDEYIEEDFDDDKNDGFEDWADDCCNEEDEDCYDGYTYSWLNDSFFNFPYTAADDYDDDDDCIIFDDDIELSDFFDNDEAIELYC